MTDKISIIDTEALSGAAVKLLDMIEKGIGWIVSPKGGRKDLEDAWLYYKKSIMEDITIPPLVRASKIATARKDLIQYINQGKIIEKTVPLLKSETSIENLDLDWLSYFFSYAKNIHDDTIQTIWANLLAEECNGSTSIQRNLIHVLSLMDTSTAKAFMELCRTVIEIPVEKISLAFDTRYIPKLVPLITPYRWYSIFFILPDDSKDKQVLMNYTSCVPTPEQLVVMSELGLINILEDAKAEFYYPYNFGLMNYKFGKKGLNKNEHILTEVTRKDYIINYYEDSFIVTPKNEIYREDPENISLGLVQLTSIGEVLCKAINTEQINDYELFLEKFFLARGFLLKKVQ